MMGKMISDLPERFPYGCKIEYVEEARRSRAR